MSNLLLLIVRDPFFVIVALHFSQLTVFVSFCGIFLSTPYYVVIACPVECYIISLTNLIFGLAWADCLFSRKVLNIFFHIYVQKGVLLFKIRW